MKREGIIDYHLATFRILNMEALTRAAREHS
jgi:hypothetical protein